MDFNLTLIIFIALIISLYIKYRANIRRDIKKNEKALRENFGKKSERKKFSPEEYGIISHYYKNRDRFENGKIRKNESGIIDEITWNDLNMDDIYASMNYCCSQMGDEYLYDILHRPSGDADLLRERGRVIKWFDSHEDERIALQKAFLSIGRTGKYSLTDHLLKLDEVKEESNFLHYLCIVLGFSAIAMVFINPPVGFGMILAVTAFNVGSYFKRKGETDRYITCFSYIVWTLRALKKLMNEKYDGIDSYSSRMKESYEKIKNLEKCFFLLKSGRGLTGSLAELPLDYLRIFFHLDLIKFNIMLSEVKNKRQDIFKIVDIAGFLDAMISLAHYRRTLEIYSEPEFLTEGKSFKAKGMIHPLVERAVAADIETEMGVLVTGSNASGKSTFLRSVALAVLMGETIYTVAAVH